MKLAPARPPEVYSAQDERIFRQNVEQAIARVELGVPTDPLVLSAVMTFDYAGALKVTLVGNQYVASLKAAVSTSAFPSVATVVAATATNAARADLSFTGPYALGNTLYLSALGFSGTDGSGVASVKYEAKAVVSVIQPQLVVTITQTGSSTNTTTFTMVVSDPSGLLSGNASVAVAHQGLTSLHNDTLAAAATDFNATLGSTYTFTATLDLSTNAGGYAKFTATKSGVSIPAIGLWFGNGVPQPPSLSVKVTPSTSSYEIIVTYTGTMTYKIDGGSDNNGTGSPQTITVTRNDLTGAPIAYVFKAVRDQQTITNTVIVPPKEPSMTLAISACIASDAGAAPPPYNQLDVPFTYTGMPTGTVFDVSYNNAVTDGMDSSTGIAMTGSPQTKTFSSVTFSGTPGFGAVTVLAKLNGTVIATAVRNKTYVT